VCNIVGVVKTAEITLYNLKCTV